MLITPAIYSQTNSGALYLVIGIFTHAETQEQYVAYIGGSGFWVKPLKDFTSNVEVGGLSISRFMFQKKVSPGKVGQVIKDNGRI